MTACICVGLGGAVGAVLRYLIGLIRINNAGGFPVATLLINMTGSFVIGLIAALSAKYTELDPNLILFLKTGICGGFTTFSTFALESVNLLQNGKTGEALAYIMLSIVLSFAAVLLAQGMVR